MRVHPRAECLEVGRESAGQEVQDPAPTHFTLGGRPHFLWGPWLPSGRSSAKKSAEVIGQA